MRTADLIRDLNTLLTPENYRDYAPNGLQVEGRGEVTRVVTGVTACFELIRRAAELKADLLLVHHGWFWKHEDPRITGLKGRRVRELIAADINLAGYHLPLDDHPKFGNNALLGRALDFTETGRFGEMDLGRLGSTAPVTVHELTLKITKVLKRPPLVVGPADKVIRRVAWCSGAAQDMIEEVAIAGCDAFVSGEISERTTHIAREAGITYFAAGHHATERFGIRALGEWIAREKGLEVTFVDIDNPV